MKQIEMRGVQRSFWVGTGGIYTVTLSRGTSYVWIYSPQGHLYEIQHRQHRQLHREDGPAILRYHADGSVMQACYYCNGLMHHTHGPADIQWDLSGKVWRAAYYVQGKYVTSTVIDGRCVETDPEYLKVWHNCYRESP